MRRREVEKLLFRIVKSLYLELKSEKRAYKGAVIDLDGRSGLLVEGEKRMELLDDLLPKGETGTLIWIQDNDGNIKKEI